MRRRNLAPALFSLALLAACGRTSFALDRTDPSTEDTDAGVTGLPLGSPCTEDAQCTPALFCDRLCGPYYDPSNPYESAPETYFATNGVCAPLFEAPDCNTTCRAPADCCDVTHHCRPKPYCNVIKVFHTDCAPLH